MVAPQGRFYNNSRPQELSIALRELLCHDPCAARFGAETLSQLLYEERYLPLRVDTSEVECLLEALRVEGEVLA